ncbi:MAG: Bug family tripartite tricarboxylate transporter substrate binding protein [Burkholderiales bacterium]
MMFQTARRLTAGALALAGVLFAAATPAQPFPTKPIRLVIPYTPGGPTDLVGRALAQRLQAVLGQQVVVDNRAGGGGVIAVEIVAKAAPDGYTLLLGTPGQLVLLPLLEAKLPFDAQRDFMPVTKVVDSPQVLFAFAKFPPNNVAELVAYAKQRPGQISYGSVQTGGTGHLGMELLKQATGIDMVHVPYKGTAPALTDLIAGRIQLMFSSLPSVQQHVQAGRVKLLATGARTRTDAIKDVPTVGETIPGYDLVTWYGIFAPRRTPAPVIGRLHAELLTILKSPEIAQLFAATGVEPAWTTPQELQAYMQAETERWRKVIRTAGIRLE